MLISSYLHSQNGTDSLSVHKSDEDSGKVQLTLLKINSSKSDFSPYVLNDHLLFVSGRNKDVGVQYVDMSGNSEITDIYTCAMRSPSSFRGVNGFSSDINTKYHEGPFCFNKQGTVIYYTANDAKTSRLKIYRSEKTNGRWGKPQLLPFCEAAYSYCHPALSPDGASLIFAADLEKERRGMDLYLSKYTDSSWTKPVALRSDINDSANQVFPFISAANILYFSSDKKGGTGGLDIYYVSLDSDSAKVRPMSYPLNSYQDDFGVWIDSTAETGYFSSNRGRNTKDDIYYFNQRMPDFTDARTVSTKTLFCFSFFEESTLKSKDTLNLTYEWKFGDGSKGRGLKTRHCYAAPGDYQVELNIIDKESGEVFNSQASYSLTVEWPDQLTISCPAISDTKQEIEIGSAQCYLKGYEVSKVYWSFGDGKYNTGKTVKHKYKKPGTYTIQAGLLAKNLASGKTEQFKTEKKILINKPAYDK